MATEANQQPDLLSRLEDAFEHVAVCHCGNGVRDGCCDNHAPTWNPCEDSQLLKDAIDAIRLLRGACQTALEQETARQEGGRLLRRDTVIDLLKMALAAPTPKGGA